VRQAVHIAPSLFGPDGIVGGGERYAYELARAVARVLPTTLVSFGADRLTRRDGELLVEIYPAREFIAGQQFDPLAYQFLGQIAKADIVHCNQYQIAVSQLAILAGAALGKQTFVTDLGGVGLHFDPALPVERCVTALLPISQFSRDQLPSTVPATVIYGGTTERFLATPAPADTVAAVIPSRVLFVGRIMRHKGIDTLIEGIPEGCGLDIIGRVYDDDYMSLLRRLASGRDVRFIHDASDDQLVSAYTDALVTVLPSVYRDVFGGRWEKPELLGNVLLESMTCETPTICTDVGGMPEVVDHEVTGFVVPPNDSGAISARIAQLIDQPSLRAEMGRQARAHVLSRFTWEHTAEVTLAAYRHVWKRRADRF
jgi:glycosyltransferase involved in cell wall biosynthesis